jgi:type I restriction enzyme, R subunit
VDASTLPDQAARRLIDAAIGQAGWAVQNRSALNLYAARGVAVREYALAPGYGFADYLLFVDARAVGVLEAKPAGHGSRACSFSRTALTAPFRQPERGPG